MALITTSLNTGSKPTSDIYDAFANVYDWQATIPDPANPGSTITNPETKVLHFRRKCREYVQQIYEAGLVTPAVETARTTALTNKGILT